MKGLKGVTTRRKAATTTGAAALVLLALALAGCEDGPAPPKMPGDPKPPAAQVSVRLSALTPEPSQGKVVIIDYEGPAFDESDLRVRLAGEALPATVVEDEIGVLLPLSHSGATLLAFDFGGGRAAALTLNATEAPPIPNPRQYLDTEITKLASALSERAAQESELQGLHEAVLRAQEQLAALDEQEIAYAATLFKQNIEPSLEQLASSGLLQTAVLRTAGFDATKCNSSMIRSVRLVAKTTAISLFGGLLWTASPGPQSVVLVPMGGVALVYAAFSVPDALGSIVETFGNCMLARVGAIEPFLPLSSIQIAQVGAVADPLPRLSFRDGEPLEVNITVAYRIQHDLREGFLSAILKLRSHLLKLTGAARPVCERCAAWLNRQAERIPHPDSVEREERVPASGFVLKGVSNAAVTGTISGVDGDRLSLTFTVDLLADDAMLSDDASLDFDFILANSSIGLDDTAIPGRVFIDVEPVFLDTVSDQTYEIDTAIEPLVLPEATLGNPPLTYSLFSDVAVPGLLFDPASRTLSGTPTTAGTYPMLYTVTDDDGDFDTLSFTLVVTAASGDVLIPQTVVVPGGTFRMGSLNDWGEGGKNYLAHGPYKYCANLEIDEIDYGCYTFPVHTVTVPSFAVGVYEVTNAQWNACVAGGACRPSPYAIDATEPNHPVWFASWNEVQVYLAWLSERTGVRYRLPSEAEWEYAARAGTTTLYHTGNTISTDQANFGDHYGGITPVGSFAPNAFGLYDVHGNVAEWVQDCRNAFNYVGAPADGSAWESSDCSDRIQRSHWEYYPPEAVRSAHRTSASASDHYGGFRVARAIHS